MKGTPTILKGGRYSRRRVYILLIYVGIGITLGLNFKANICHGAGDYYTWFQYDTESMVAGRLALSQKEGLFAHGGFLGWVQPVPPNTDKYWYQYDVYRYGLDFENYEGYYSQPGGQAFVYGLMSKLTGLSGNAALELFWWLASLTAALAFTVFIAWAQRRWDWATALMLLLCILFSQWTTMFGYNMFWVLGAFYLPFIAALWYLQRYEPRVKHPLRTGFWVMFVCMLLKCMFNGFEFITTALVMAVTPWVFYAIAGEWGAKRFLRSFAAASAGAVTAVFTALVGLAVQLSFVMGSLGEGVRYILWSYGKRTHGGGGEFDAVFQESIDSSQWDVLVTYWNGHAFDLSHWSANPLWQTLSRVSFGFCIVIFLLVSLLVWFSKTVRRFPAFRRQQLALVAMLWVSLLAPLSWFIIFKGHSYIHTHMDHIVWYMPFMLLGFTLACSTLCFYIRQKLFRRYKPESMPETSVQPARKYAKRKLALWSVSIILILILLRLFVFEPVRVAGSSMENCLAQGDWIIVNKLCYGGRFPRRIADIPLVNVLTWSKSIRENDHDKRWHYRRMAGYDSVQRHDVVVFIRPGVGELVKRVVGLPGERVEIRSGKVWINDELVEDPPLVIPGFRNDTVLRSVGWTLQDYGPVLIPAAQDGVREYFVLGDHRDYSSDSRQFGRITEEQIVGKASFVLFPARKGTAVKRHFFQPIQ